MAAEITQVDKDTARAFWKQQDDAQIFLHPDVLGALCPRVDWWLARWNRNPVCLWPVCHSDDGSYRPPELSSYVGPLWHDSLSGHKAHRWWTIVSETQRVFIAFLAARYQRLVFELPPGSRDVRVFQWFAAEAAEVTDLQIECRHTALIRTPMSAEADLTVDFSRNRMRDLRNPRARDYQEWLDPDPHALFNLYQSMLGGKQESQKAQRRDREVAELVALAQGGFGRVIAYCDPDGQPASFTLLLASRRTALQLLIASSDAARGDGLQAAVQLQAMERSFAEGMTTFDFAGGNSPLGAEEKHRYGAWPQMYFRITVVSR